MPSGSGRSPGPSRGRNSQARIVKPSVAVTTNGTQIFIPAYLSFDARRGLNLGLITILRRARGVARQGGKLSMQRLSLVVQRRLARTADGEAPALKLSGDKRYAHICRRLAGADCLAVQRSLRFLLPLGG